MESMIEEMARQNDRVIGLCVIMLVVIVGLAWIYCTAYANRQKEMARKAVAKARVSIMAEYKDELKHKGAAHLVEKFDLMKELRDTKSELEKVTKELNELRALAEACSPTGVRIVRKK